MELLKNPWNYERGVHQAFEVLGLGLHVPTAGGGGGEEIKEINIASR